MELLTHLKENNLTLKYTTKTVGTLDGTPSVLTTLELKATDVESSHECVYVAKSANGKYNLPYVAKVEDYASTKQALEVLMEEVANQSGGVFLTGHNSDPVRTFSFGSDYDLDSVLALLSNAV